MRYSCRKQILIWSIDLKICISVDQIILVLYYYYIYVRSLRQFLFHILIFTIVVFVLNCEDHALILIMVLFYTHTLFIKY